MIMKVKNMQNMDEELKIGDLVSCKYINGIIGQVTEINDGFITAHLVTPVFKIDAPISSFSKIQYYEN